jgi:RNA polymerase sigma factor (sigma-70 family)
MIETDPADTLVTRAAHAFADFRAGDRSSFDRLVEAVTPLMWRAARGAGLDQVSAEDVLQTVWMSLLHNAESVRDPQTIVKWLLTAARREAWRVSRRRREEVQRSAAVFGVDSEEAMTLPHDVPGPDDVVFRDDRQRLLWQHVQELPVRCRQLIAVVAFADRPDYAHLATALGMPVGSIGPTRGRCLAKLRDLLARDPHWPDSDWEGQL